ncbi:acyl carrier protein [Streptomyces wuyuanensis]|uniref:acyl carrier protein n=1 Tax=Streptomyces wuyuanensis TaxID=1196353 RepID=UPI003721FD8E
MKWTPEFDEILRRNLPLSNGPVSADTSLSNLGLDSLATVSLVIDLEEGLGVSIPDSLLVAKTFETADTLWSVIASLDSAV